MKQLLTHFCVRETMQKSSQMRHLLTSLFLVMVLSIVNLPSFAAAASATEIITEVSAVNIPFSTVEGFTPSYIAQGNVEVGDPEKYEAVATWFDVTVDEYVNGIAFVDGHTYRLMVWFYAKGGYAFADDCTATINGMTAEATWYNSNEYDYRITFTATAHNCSENATICDEGLNAYYTCAKCRKHYEDAECTKEIESSILEQYKNTIFNPSITVTAPVVGEVANNEATVGNSSLYSCEGHWDYTHIGREFSGVFEENAVYWYSYTIRPINPSHIISDYAYINGIECRKAWDGSFNAEFIPVAAPSTPTAIESVNAENGAKAIKTIENGRVVIIRDGKKYDVSGREL